MRGSMAEAFRAFLAGALVFALAAAATGVGGCASGDRNDPKFDTRVADPAYESGGPRVLFDEGHRNWHRARGSYQPFVRLMESDGYRISTTSKPVTRDALAPYAVFVVSNAVGANERNDAPAFDDSECDAVRDWVAGGGSLLLVTDHFPTGHAAESLAARFGVRLSKGDVADSSTYDRAFEPTHLVFSRENGGLAAHPILEGRNARERVERVLTFTGEAVDADSPAVGFLRLSDTAEARSAKVNVEHRGSDVLVNVTYENPVSAAGWSQGVALEWGKGRVVVLGEAAMLSARLNRYDGGPVGMNVPGYDNRQLALNLMHWLTRRL
ncbi:MAG TPA: hypothetical protein VFU59_05735 [Candidatus Eisenbacteria bacterium]|nr:hypothetical protein [Candidatus Eisenbacteria bacterium]